MFLISHRGNTEGPKPELENRIEYIQSALSLGYDIEVDVWQKEDKLFLGHDIIQEEISLEFLSNSRIWCHAKTIDTVYLLSTWKQIHCFYHERDSVTLTSRGFIWTFPGNHLTPLSICITHENPKNKYFKGCGICSDYILHYAEKLNVKRKH